MHLVILNEFGEKNIFTNFSIKLDHLRKMIKQIYISF